jgi:hypothetical protein
MAARPVGHGPEAWRDSSPQDREPSFRKSNPLQERLFGLACRYTYNRAATGTSSGDLLKVFDHLGDVRNRPPSRGESIRLAQLLLHG